MAAQASNKILRSQDLAITGPCRDKTGTIPAVAQRTRDDDMFLAHLLWEVSTRVGAMGDARLAEQGLTFAAIGLLESVAAEPGVTVAGLARRSPKSPQAVSQVASRLEKLGHIERKLGSGRGVGLHITPSGDQLRKQGNAAEAVFDDELTALLGEPAEQLRALLAEARSRLRDA
jgi:DNA-binding MarR family transcriptional regulator